MGSSALEIVDVLRPVSLATSARVVLSRMVGREFADEDLHRRYLERIPVVAVDGAEAFDLFVDEEALRALLQ